MTTCEDARERLSAAVDDFERELARVYGAVGAAEVLGLDVAAEAAEVRAVTVLAGEVIRWRVDR